MKRIESQVLGALPGGASSCCLGYTFELVQILFPISVLSSSKLRTARLWTFNIKLICRF